MGSEMCIRDRLWILRSIFGTRLSVVDDTNDDDVRVEMRGHNDESVAGEIAGLGRRVEVVDPPSVREQLARIGRQLTDAYGPSHA